MTVPRFRTEQGFEVIIGWRGPGRRFVVTVYQDAGLREARLLYSSLEDERIPAGGMGLGDLAERLHEMQISPPPGLLERLRQVERSGEGGARTTS